MKKIISVLLSCALLFGVCAPMALAAESETETVFFETDFEAFSVGDEPKQGFDGSAITATARITVEEDDGNKVAKYWLNNAERPSGPRLEKYIPMRGLKQMTIEYDVKSSGGESVLSVNLYDKDVKATLSKKPMAPCEFEKWTRIRIEVDFTKLTATAYADDKKVQDTELNSFNADTLSLWFGSSIQLDGSYMLLDNIKIYTKQANYNPNADMTLDDIAGTVNKADAVEESGDIFAIIDEDFEAQAVDALVQMRPSGGFGTSAIKETAPIYVRQADGNKYAHAYHGNPAAPDTTQGQRLGKTMSFIGINDLVLDFDVKSSKNGKSTMSVYIVDSETSKTKVSVTVPTTFDDWMHIKVRYDFENKTAKLFVGGKLYKEFKADLGDAVNGDFRIVGQMHSDGSDWMIDNFKLSTPDKNAGGIVNLAGEFMVDQVKLPETEKIGMVNKMRTTHPRIMLTDWAAVRAKIDTDENYKIWYKRTIETADNIVRSAPVEYVVNARNNINESSTRAKTYMISLAGAYGLTGDKRYKDRLFQEIENVGSWPDWDGKTYLCTAHLILGASIAYDWLYNDWTEEERSKVLNVLVQKGASQAVLGYEKMISGTGNWINSVSNWNNVCNGSNTIMAIAIADEYPELSEYIFAKANLALQESFVEVSADGAYAETVGYWNYGVRYQIKMMSALETAVKDGEKLPARLDYTNNVGLNNTGDFPIYYNGTTAAFNYGDGVPEIMTSSILYWLATKYDKPRYAWYNIYMVNNYAAVGHPKDHNTILSILWYDAEHAKGADPAAALDKFYSSSEPDGANGISMRSSWTDQNALVVMAHAGDASTGHINHDAGGFVLDWAGERWVHMYGRNPPGLNAGILYAWDGYFTINQQKGGRFQYYHTRGEANNTIIANPKQGEADMKVEYYAQVIRSDSSDNKAYGIIDMTQTNADYIDAKRGFMLTDNRETMIIQDEIKANKPSEFYWFANTHADVTLAADGKSAFLEMGEKMMLVRITQGPADAKIGVMKAEPLPTSPDPDIQPDYDEQKLFIHVENVQELNLTVEFVPLHEGEGVPPAQPVAKLSDWTVADSNANITSQKMGDIVALMVDNPNAYAKGAKTYVDTANLDIAPVVQNGRTLVPVRFISEKFGAAVGWDSKTETVTVETQSSKIQLQIGSNQMYVNGEAITLDVAAQTIGGRTVIPLRALVEALGKSVFWDDRGLISITDKPTEYDETTINNLIDLLDIRVQVGGKELKFFDSEVYDYYYGVEEGDSTEVTATATAGATVVQGNPATVTVAGKTYNIHFTKTVVGAVYGDVNAVRKIVLEPYNGPKPEQKNYIDIQSATSSIEWTADKYPMDGTYDGVINDSITLNRWSAQGLGHWIAYDLGSVQNVHSIAIAGYLTAARSYTYKVEVSVDGENWEVAHEGAKTTSGTDRNVFKLGDKQARFVRLTGTAFEGATWLGICEVRLYANAEQEAADQSTWSSEFYAGMIHGLVGDTRKVVIYGVNGRNEKIDLDMSTLNISTTNASVATVDAAGNVMLVGTGDAVINVEAMIGGTARTYTIDVRVQ